MTEFHDVEFETTAFWGAKGNKKLFKGLYIENKWKFEEYPILGFDFNEINNKTSYQLELSIKMLLYDFFKTNRLNKPSSDDIS